MADASPTTKRPSKTDTSSTNTKSMSRTSAQKRLLSELQEERRHATPLIYINFCESNIQRLTALILGPSDTPYAGGFFRFAITVPDTYPHTPPTVTLLTTDGGRVRFNPNLYASGKVCLSILGTWSGPPWNSSHTIASVLLSIQSLMNDAPIRNEPGLWAADDRQVDSYNRRVMYETVRVAVVDAMNIDRKKDGGFFTRVYDLHFVFAFEQYECLIEQLKQCINDKKTKSNTAAPASGSGHGGGENKPKPIMHMEVSHHHFQSVPGSATGTSPGTGATRRGISGLKSVGLADIEKLHEQLESLKSCTLKRLSEPLRLFSSDSTSPTPSCAATTATCNNSDTEKLKFSSDDEDALDSSRSRLYEALQSQHESLKKHPCAYGSMSPSRDLSVWHGSVFGPIGTPYDGAILAFDLVFPSSYPAHAPFVTFCDPASIFHPNVTKDGVPLLPSSVGVEVKDVVKALVGMLENVSMNFIVNKEAGDLYMNDRKAFNRRVRDAVGL